VIIGLALPAAVVGGAARPVMDVFGQGFTKAAPALAITMLNPLLVSVSTMLGSSIVAAGRPGLTNFSSMVSFPINLAAVVVLTPILGVTGPAFGPVLGPLCGGTVNLLMARKAHGVRVHAHWSRRFLPVAFTAYAAGFIVAHVVGDLASGFVMLAPALLAGALAYFGTFVTLGGLTAADRQRLGQLRKRLTARRRSHAEPRAATQIAG
jgi:O-antigen/teichoic acid export membrane protein